MLCCEYRAIALTVILTRAGLGLDPVALRKLSFGVLRLAFSPCIIEAVTAAVASHFILGFPWVWGFMLGCVSRLSNSDHSSRSALIDSVFDNDCKLLLMSRRCCKSLYFNTPFISHFSLGKPKYINVQEYRYCRYSALIVRMCIMCTTEPSKFSRFCL